MCDLQLACHRMWCRMCCRPEGKWESPINMPSLNDDSLDINEISFSDGDLIFMSVRKPIHGYGNHIPVVLEEIAEIASDVHNLHNVQKSIERWNRVGVVLKHSIVEETHQCRSDGSDDPDRRFVLEKLPECSGGQTRVLCATETGVFVYLLSDLIAGTTDMGKTVELALQHLNYNWTSPCLQRFYGFVDDIEGQQFSGGRCNDTMEDLMMRVTQSILNEKDKRRKALERMFYDIDTDESGIISCHEVEPLLTKVLGIKPTPVQLDNFIIALDEDGDGEISFEEFFVYSENKASIRRPVRNHSYWGRPGDPKKTHQIVLPVVDHLNRVISEFLGVVFEYAGLFDPWSTDHHMLTSWRGIQLLAPVFRENIEHDRHERCEVVHRAIGLEPAQLGPDGDRPVVKYKGREFKVVWVEGTDPPPRSDPDTKKPCTKMFSFDYVEPCARGKLGTVKLDDGSEFYNQTWDANFDKLLQINFSYASIVPTS